MANVEFICNSCSKVFYDEALPRRGSICFACHISTVNLGFTYGKTDFHGDTIRQRQNEQMRLTPDAVPVGERWV